MSDFVFPPYRPFVPPFGPREYPCRKDDRYSACFMSIDGKYKTVDKVLKAGTTLYRGTLFDTLYNPKNEMPVFFGLDIVISTWILCENYYREKNEELKIGYIHEFTLKKDLNYEYITDLDCTPLNCTPLNEKTNEKTNKNPCYENPCVHPQVILHTGVGIADCAEVGTEITLPIKYVNNEYLEYKKSYEVNIQTLIDNQHKHYLQFDFKNALLPLESYNFTFPVAKQSGSGKSKKTKEKVKCKDGKMRTVYVGPRGGRYVKIQGELKRLTS